MDIGGLLIGGVLCAFSSALLFQRFHRRNLARQCEDWPCANAIILKSEIQQRDCDLAQLFEPRINYRYCVNGVTFTGSNISFELPSFSASHARQLVAQYQVGATVSVRYNPSNPGIAALERTSPYPAVGVLEFAPAVVGVGILLYMHV